MEAASNEIKKNSIKTNDKAKGKYNSEAVLVNKYPQGAGYR